MLLDAKGSVSPENTTQKPLRLLVISSVSGAGRSTAEVALEDLGYYAISNLPTNLWSTAIQQILDRREKGIDEQYPMKGLVLSVYSNPAQTDTQQILSSLLALRQWPELNVEHIHLVCDDDVLVRRFSTTRRKHAFATDRPLVDGISAEKSFLADLRMAADTVIDTSLLAPKDLSHRMLGFTFEKDSSTLVVGLSSFAFKRGMPRESDLVFDARFLRNPHYVEELRPLTGQNKKVADYVKADPDYETFVGSIMNVLKLCLPRFERDGKSYLTISIGCTGGKHRSVTIAEDLSTRLTVELDYPTTLRHREA